MFHRKKNFLNIKSTRQVKDKRSSYQVKNKNGKWQINRIVMPDHEAEAREPRLDGGVRLVVEVGVLVRRKLHCPAWPGTAGCVNLIFTDFISIIGAFSVASFTEIGDKPRLLA